MAMYLRLTIEGVDEERNVVGLRAGGGFRGPPVLPYAADEGRWASIVADERDADLLPSHAEFGRIWAAARAKLDRRSSNRSIITTWLGRMLESWKSCCISRRMSSQIWTASQLLSVVMAPSVSRNGVLTG